MASTGRPQDSDGGPNWLVVGRDDGGVSILHAKPGGGGETLRYDLRAGRLTSASHDSAIALWVILDGGLHVL